METPSPAAPDNVTLAGSLLSAANFRLEIKAASGTPVTPPADNEDEDVDGCDVQVDVPTRDEDLPVAEGGVA